MQVLLSLSQPASFCFSRLSRLLQEEETTGQGIVCKTTQAIPGQESRRGDDDQTNKASNDSQKIHVSLCRAKAGIADFETVSRDV